MKTLHRTIVAATLVTVVVNLVLALAGAISSDTFWFFFLVLELPLIGAFVLVSVLRVRRVRVHANDTGLSTMAYLLEEEPALRAAKRELGIIVSPFRLIVRRLRGTGPGIYRFDYTKGSLAMPVAMLIVTAIEIAVVHFLVPWVWLKVILLVLGVYAAVFVIGIFADRKLHPHELSDEGLKLNWGQTEVLTTALANVVEVRKQSVHKYTYTTVDGSTLVLTALSSTNIAVDFDAPVSAYPPLPRKLRSPGYRAQQALIYVADPDAFAASFAELTSGGQ